ncbi:MAG: threonine ammonia-lyase [Desulfuromonadia bacterium]
MLDYDLILDARERLEKRVRFTETIHSHHFSERFGYPLLFKCENLQRTGAFKLRGALNVMTALDRRDLSRGVITASAGNHAQGVAYGADLLGVRATIFMPESTPLQKVLATKEYGAEVILTGRSFDESCAAAIRAAEESGARFIHPFDDDLVMAGQGTIGLEILKTVPDVRRVIVPVGGGGLIAGIATAIRTTHPRVEIIGVESFAAPSMETALRKGRVEEIPISVSLADGIAVMRPGERCFDVIRRLVDQIVLVEEEEIALAIVALLEKTKLLVEGAGGVGLAALLSGRIPGRGGKTVCLLSGGNIDVKTISVVVERGLLAAGRYLKLKIELDDMPGALARLSAEIAKTNANISIITHDRRSKTLPIGKTEVLIELETRGEEHIRSVIQHLVGAGYRVGHLP